MKTTLNLDDDLVRAAKQRALTTDRTLTAMIDQALRQLLDAEKRAAKPYRFDWKPIRGRRPPAVDVSDRDRLYDFLENRG